MSKSIIPAQGSLLAGVTPVPNWLRQRALQLTSGPSSEISATASDIEAAKHWLEVLRRQVPPSATAEEIDDQIDIMASLPWQLPQSLVAGGRTEALFRSAFKADLGHLPADVLAAGCKAARMDAERRFFPTTGALLEYCRGTERYVGWAAQLREIEGVRRLSMAWRKRPKEETAVPASAWAELRARLEGKTGKARRDHEREG